MADQQITKRFVDSLRPGPAEFTKWDSKMPGFGVRVRPSGAMTFIVTYRAGSGRGAPVRRFTIGAVGKITAEEARTRARVILGDVAHGRDPAGTRAAEREMPTVAELADRFLSEHAESKCKARTAEFYRDMCNRLVKPAIGTAKADKVTRAQVVRLHGKLRNTPFAANRVIATISAMYAFAARVGIVPEGTNPARGIEKYREQRRERFLTKDELDRLGTALRDAETTGIPWTVDETSPKAKHAPKAANRVTRIGPFAAAAIRLLLFTGCRLREILNLRWSDVDLERGLLFLPDSKTGKKTVVLNAPAAAILAELPHPGVYVIAGETAGTDKEVPRADLKRPWQAVAARAGLEGVRLHDLRHTFASYGAAGGLGLPVIGKLLGHTQAATTSRYAHLDNDPLRRGAQQIGSVIAAAMGENGYERPEATVVDLNDRRAG